MHEVWSNLYTEALATYAILISAIDNIFNKERHANTALVNTIILVMGFVNNLLVCDAPVLVSNKHIYNVNKMLLCVYSARQNLMQDICNKIAMAV